MRSLARRPGYALAVIITLTLGIGANTAIFSVADALLFRPPPYPRPTELVSVWGHSMGERATLRTRTHSFANLAAYAAWQMNVGDDQNVIRADGADVSDNFFATLGVNPVRGRTFAPGANAAGARGEVVLGDALWRSQFGGDTAVVGRTILVQGAPRVVIGIMPPDFHFPSLDTKLWINVAFDPRDVGTYWGWYKYTFVGRLKPGVSLSAGRGDVHSVAPVMRHDNPLWDPGPAYGADATITPLQTMLAGPARTTMLVLLGVVLTLMLIACANVANLVFVRSIGRLREFSLRAALGCTRARMVRQLVTENLTLAGVGGAFGALAAWNGVRALRAALPPQIPRTAVIGVDGRVLGFAAALTVLSGLLFGLVPALRATWPGRAAGIVSGRNPSPSAGHNRVAGALTIAQLALAVVLVAGAGLLLRSFDALRGVDPGFAADRVLAARVTLPTAAYPYSQKSVTFFETLLDGLERAPGVTSAAAVNRPPLRGPVYGTAIRVEGQFEDVKHSLPDIAHAQTVTPRYFEAMGIRLVRGRAFTSGDRADAAPVAIVSASVAKKFWPGQDAVGKRIGQPYASPWITIVGVAEEVQQDSLSGRNEMTVYRPLAQAPDDDMTIVVRTTQDPAAFAATVRSAVARLDRGTPVSDVRPMRAVVSASLARARFTAALLGGFAALALLLGAVGIYGVIAFTVAQRTREFGVRIALGATSGSLLRDVLARGAVLGGTGVALGVVAALGVTRVLANLLYGVGARDAVTLVGAPVLLFAVALLATWLPSRRAVRADPLVALRGE